MKKIFFKLGKIMFCIIKRHNVSMMRYSLYQRVESGAKFLGSSNSSKVLILLAYFISNLIR